MAPHTGFIVAAFAVTGVVLVGMIAAILLDYRAQLRALSRLTARLDRRGPLPEGQSDDDA